MRKVLVADGAAGSRELLRVLLEHEGFEVIEASDGLEALEKARTMLPDLILLDVDLPAFDGYAAVRELRSDERLRSRSIVALIPGARRDERDGLVRAGFSGYIAKPLVLRVLREELSAFGFASGA